MKFTFKNVSVYTCAVWHYAVLSRFSHDRLFATLWAVTLQAPLSMGFSRQEYWSGLPFPPPGNLLEPGIEPMSPALQILYLLSHLEAIYIHALCFSSSVVSYSLRPHEL